jgi:hypothetical protein
MRFVARVEVRVRFPNAILLNLSEAQVNRKGYWDTVVKAAVSETQQAIESPEEWLFGPRTFHTVSEPRRV